MDIKIINIKTDSNKYSTESNNVKLIKIKLNLIFLNLMWYSKQKDLPFISINKVEMIKKVYALYILNNKI